ncbi:MAG: nucleotide exchange factor GrpE [Patescibacteria group bacterium]
MEEQTSQSEEKKEPADKEIDELSKCQKERDEYLDGWRRAKAELLNYKKEEIKRFEVFAKLANEGLIRELLMVLNSFDLGLASLSPHGRSPEGREKDDLAQKGMYLIRSQLRDILKSHGLEEITISAGENFNSATQEAVAEIESDQPTGTIIEEVEKGYLLNGRVIKPARVKVSK